MCGMLANTAAALALVLSAAGSIAAGDRDEAWVSRAVLAELDRVARGGDMNAMGKRVEAVALARLRCGRLERTDALIDLIYAARACAALPAVRRRDGGAALTDWLLAHRDVTRRLLRALGDVDDPAAALGRFARLVEADAAGVIAHPGLAAAFATARPLSHYRRQPDPASLTESFAYYTDPNRRFHFDPAELPFELARYLADTRLSLAEREWAWKTYGRRHPGRAYFHVAYDEGHFRDGRARRIASLPYSLPNLLREGGVCLDRAYYAAEVCKAVGIPAAIVHGRGGAGVRHAWFAHCRASSVNGRPIWTSATGRYAGRKYFVGTVRNPADGERILDAELVLSGAAGQLPLRRREEADAAVALACLADGYRDGEGPGGVGALDELAGLYRRRHADKPGAPPLETSWIEPVRRIDLALVEDLILAAIARNPAQGGAWRLVLELRRADRLPVGHLNRFFTVLIGRTAENYPEYSCAMVLGIVPTLPDAAHRRAVLQRAMTVYHARPDLTGRLRIALGDEWHDAGEADKALVAYREAAVESLGVAEVVVRAASRAEKLLTAAGGRDRAVALYRALFERTRRQDVAAEFRAETAHYQLGRRLAELLEQAGRAGDARRVRSQL